MYYVEARSKNGLFVVTGRRCKTVSILEVGSTVLGSGLRCRKYIEILVLEGACLSCSCKHLGRKNLVKSLLISTLDKVIYYIGTFLQGSTKPLFTSQNRVETS
jgi:hypothetical protein